jgi:hypothetical protein
MKEDIERLHSNIFDHIEEYSLVKEFLNGRHRYSIYHKVNMAYVHIEQYYDEVVELLIAKGIQIGASVDEIKPKDFKPAPPLVWDEVNGGWKQLTMAEFEQYLKERAEKKRKK